MFVDLRVLENVQDLDVDLCIVGAGPAGIVIARKFAGTKTSVCLIESGDFDPRPENQDLADGEMVSHPHNPLRTSRDRQFGGSTNSWGGACAPMSSSDFDDRPWIDLEGWPYSMRELLPHYRQAQELFEIGAYNYDPGQWADHDIRFLGFDENKLENRIWQFSPGTNFGKVHREELESSTNIIVLLNANASNVLTNASASVVLRCRRAIP